MTWLEEFRLSSRNQRRLIKHRTDRWTFRLALMALWMFGFGFLFAVIRGVANNDLGTSLWWTRHVPSHLVVSFCITICIFGAYRGFEVLAPQHWIDTLNGWKDWRGGAFHASLSTACSALGMVLGLALVNEIWTREGFTSEGFAELVSNLAFWREFAIISVIITIVMGSFYRSRWRREHLQARATEAQLKLLQGQIEPHFLFNTLANVQSLIDFDPANAKLMLERFTDYLRASMVQMRKDDTTVAQEFAMMASYLGLMQIRMQQRLRYHFELQPGLEACVLPPLLVQPLIENAIHHGLEPKIEGGELRVSASREGADLVIEVADDGQGLEGPRRPGSKGNGIALENIRSRLASRWGARASLTLTPRTGGGTAATLRLPLSST